MAAYFQQDPMAVLRCAFLQFGSAAPLGFLRATIVSRLQFLGVKAAGANGGLAASVGLPAARRVEARS